MSETEETEGEEVVVSVAANNKTEFKVDATRVLLSLLLRDYDPVRFPRSASIDMSRPDDSAMRSSLPRSTTNSVRRKIRANIENMLIPSVRNTQMTSMWPPANKYLKFFSQIQLHSMNVCEAGRDIHTIRIDSRCLRKVIEDQRIPCVIII